MKKTSIEWIYLELEKRMELYHLTFEFQRAIKMYDKELERAYKSGFKDGCKSVKKSSAKKRSVPTNNKNKYSSGFSVGTIKI